MQRQTNVAIPCCSEGGAADLVVEHTQDRPSEVNTQAVEELGADEERRQALVAPSAGDRGHVTWELWMRELEQIVLIAVEYLRTRARARVHAHA